MLRCAHAILYPCCTIICCRTRTDGLCRRFSTFAYYMFYKNIANVLVMYLYSLTAMASGGRLFLTIYIEIYNLAYTALPVVLFGVNDQALV